jgi:hypothetical protein
VEGIEGIDHILTGCGGTAFATRAWRIGGVTGRVAGGDDGINSLIPLTVLVGTVALGCSSAFVVGKGGIRALGDHHASLLLLALSAPLAAEISLALFGAHS